MNERQTEPGSSVPSTSIGGGGGGGDQSDPAMQNAPPPGQQSSHAIPGAGAGQKCETLFRKFLETQAPEIVRSHGVPRNHAVIFGLVIVFATLANFGIAAYFGWDQSRNLGSQTGIQGLAERAAVAEVLSKAINSLNQAVMDLNGVSNALNQYSDGKFIFRGAKLDSWSVDRVKFVPDFCMSPAIHTTQACLDGNIHELLKSPSLELTDGSQIQLAMTLEMLTQIADAITQPSLLVASNTQSGNSIAGILKNARDTCESMASGGAASQIEGSFTSGITPSSFATALTLSTAIDATIRSAEPLFEGYARVRDSNPQSSTVSRSNSDPPADYQVSAFEKNLNLLNKAIKNSSDSTFTVKSVQDFTAAIGLALSELKKKLPLILSDCQQRRVIFGDRLNKLTLKSSDLERLTKE